MNYFKNRINAFGFAFSGIWHSFKSEAHIKILFLASIAVIATGLYFKVTKLEWMVLLICCGFVISLELVNSAIEKLCDAFTTDNNATVKYVKDVMAGAVLVTSITALIIGILIFYPYLKQFLN